MLPEAPALFSTITGCPHFFDSFSPDDARQQVRDAARREGHDDVHGPGRIFLRRGDAGCDAKDCDGEELHARYGAMDYLTSEAVMD